MKKYIIIFSLIAFATACKHDKKIEGNLQQQKIQIQKQIDSLHNVLEKINEQLGVQQTKEIPAIQAIKIEPKAFEHYIELQGNIDTDGNVMLVPEAMGSVKKIYKNEGDKVRKGEIVMLLDDAVIRNQIDEVRTQYSLAKTAYDRQKRLWNQKIGSEMAFLQAKTKKNTLAKKLITLRSQLAKFKVKAPINGTLDDLMTKEGEMAAPQRPVARIVNLDEVYAQADVSEKYLSKVRKGTPVVIDFPELNSSINAKINYVGNFIHPRNRTFKIRINLSNKNAILKPNLTANIKIKDYETGKKLVLPWSIVQQDREGNNFVFVLKPAKNEGEGVYKVEKRIIKTGIDYKGNVIIESGIKEGELIAGEAARGLTEGDFVRVESLKVESR